MKQLFKVFILTIIVVCCSTEISAQIYTDSNGRVGIGTTSPQKKLDIEGGSLRVRYSNTSPYRRRAFDINTTAADPRLESERYIVFYNTPRVSFIDIYAKTLYERSDKKDKENIIKLDDSYVSKLSQLDGVSYNWKSDISKKAEIGFLAQDVEKVFPEVVRGVDGIEGKSISYSHMVPILVEAIKEQQTAIQSLTVKLEELQKKWDITNKPTNTVGSKLIKSFPNPTDGDATVKLFIENKVKDAKIVVSTINGQVVNSYTITERGDVSYSINNQNQENGVYIYSLLIENQKIDSQKIILK